MGLQKLDNMSEQLGGDWEPYLQFFSSRLTSQADLLIKATPGPQRELLKQRKV